MAPGHSGQRARIVCHRCHEKKIRCDLQLATSGSTRSGTCSPCTAAEAECEFRPSNKGRRPKRDVLSGRAELSTDRLNTDHFALPVSRLPSIVAECAPGIDQDRLSREIDHIDDVPPGLQQSNLETFWEFIYPWCPVIDPGPDAAAEPVLRHAVALLAGSVNPPLIPHASPSEHYQRARQLFYASDAIDVLTRIKAALLLSCGRPGSPSVGSMDSAFWWLGEAIRLAQDAGLHHEPPAGTSKEMSGLRRRIWWTLYARDRVIALFQGKPCAIHEDYSDVEPPQVEDYPSNSLCYAVLFTKWVSLCETIGFVNKQMSLSRRTGNALPTHEIADRLTRWLRGLSPALHLPISTDRTTPFDRHVHFLYLPYLATIAVVYVNTSQRLPEACVAAVIAGACIARIFEDLLARGCVRFLLGHGEWYITIAALALRPLRSLDFLANHAESQLRILSIAIKQLSPISQSARVIEAGMSRLLSKSDFEHALRAPLQGHDRASKSARGQPSTLDDLCAGDGVVWSEFFPFVTAKTSPLLEAILTECQHSFPELWPEVDLREFNDFLEEFSGGSPIDYGSSGTMT